MFINYISITILFSLSTMFKKLNLNLINCFYLLHVYQRSYYNVFKMQVHITQESAVHTLLY